MVEHTSDHLDHLGLMEKVGATLENFDQSETNLMHEASCQYQKKIASDRGGRRGNR